MNVDTYLHRGKDFRTSFGKIGGLRALTKAPVISLTASAPPVVEQQLIESLSMHDATFIKHTLDRPNIFYSVMKKTSMAVSAFVRKLSCFKVHVHFCREI